MATTHPALVPLERSVARVPQTAQSAVLGTAWVALNVLLVFLGKETGHPITCAILAGCFDGLIASMIAVALFSHKFQVGVTGLVSGYGFNNLANGFAPLKQSMQNVHEKFEGVLQTVSHDEALHEVIQTSAFWIAITAALVILAALVIQWIRTGDGAPAA